MYNSEVVWQRRLWLYRSSLQVQLLNDMIYKQMKDDSASKEEDEFCDAVTLVSTASCFLLSFMILTYSCE